jgi:hypothetical protein
MGKKKINAVKTKVDGILFDSQTEANFYRDLKANTENLGIQEIICHPTFHIIKPFEVTCYKCRGQKQIPSTKTSKLVKCPRCKGRGTKSRKGTDYTPDFMVIYNDGHYQYFDVKGWVNDRFPVIKKAFENIIGEELIVVTWDKEKRQWVWK